MKTNGFVIIATLFCFAFGSTTLKAQVDLTANPVTLLFGDINVGIDAKISNNFSLGATAGYGKGDLWGLVDSRQSILGTLTGKYYFSPKHGADGFYVNGFGRYTNRNLQASYKNDPENVGRKGEFTRQQVGIGFGLGYKAISNKGFVFDIGTGIGRSVFSHNSTNYDENEYKIPEFFRTMGYFRIGLGYRFGMDKE
ncbi:MAG: DUF3575 domain-containing protein [Saprospiraceae bacterium]|nr:DUF3575 domain-containing protein [Saprospiraceae bacterium]